MKEYVVYFLGDYMKTFRNKKRAMLFIQDCLEFDKENENPYGVDINNYEIVEVDGD